MWRQLIPGLRMTLALTILTGLLYPGLITAICQVAFPAKANGSLIPRDGRTIGSALIGQNFTRPEYFHPRPSAAGADGYDASASGGSNLGPTSQKLIDRVRTDAAKLGAPANTAIPADLLTTSASGLDPHISPAGARFQTARIAAARHTTPAAIEQLISAHTESRDLGFLGEPRVNVLALNLDLDAKFPKNN